MMLSCVEAGYLDAVSAALENDFVSSACVLAVTSLPELAMSDPAAAEAYPAVISAPKIDCMIAPPRSRCKALRAPIPSRNPATAVVRTRNRPSR